MKRSAWLLAGACTALIAAPAQADVVIGPRVAYYFDNSNLRTSSIEGGQAPEGGLVDESDLNTVREGFPGEVEFESQQNGRGITADQVAIPMIGAMVNFGDDRDRFTLTAMYGDGSGSVSETLSLGRFLSVAGEPAVDFGSFTSRADFQYDRYDVELSWQRRVNETFALLAGARYERLERAGPGEFEFGLTGEVDALLRRRVAELEGQDPGPDFSIPTAFIGQTQQSAASDIFSARVGATAFVPVSESAVAFFSGMLHVSYQPEFEVLTQTSVDGGAQNELRSSTVSDEASAGPDLAVGMQFVLSDNVALDVRYRAILFFPLSGDQSFSDARVNHGVNLGLSLRL